MDTSISYCIVEHPGGITKKTILKTHYGNRIDTAAGNFLIDEKGMFRSAVSDKIFIKQIFMNTYTKLEAEALAAGTTLIAVCKKQKVSPRTIERWKVEEPKTLIILQKLKDGIASFKPKPKKA
jgi:hypothetical protein